MVFTNDWDMAIEQPHWAAHPELSRCSKPINHTTQAIFMNSAVPTSDSRDSRIPLILVMIALVAALAWFVGHKAHYLTDYSPSSYGDDLWPRRVGLVLHLLGGLTAIVAGLIQIWLGLTHRVAGLHRMLGKVYAAGVLIGSAGGFYLAFTIPGQLAYRGGLIFLNVAWLITTGMALVAIRTRRLEQHREWMLRSYVVTFAFVTYRLVEMGLRAVIVLPDTPVADDIAITMAWACWAVPLLVAEPLIQLRAMRRAGRAATRARQV
jgi:uncharacterized membrane protein